MKVFSAIDNPVKGAAGQAIQSMNLMFGYDAERVKTGLLNAYLAAYAKTSRAASLFGRIF